MPAFYLDFNYVNHVYFVNDKYVPVVVEEVLGQLYANPTSAYRLSSVISSNGFEGKVYLILILICSSYHMLFAFILF
jgi:hypothetical protein